MTEVDVLHGQFERLAAAAPSAVAVVGEGIRISYQDLDSRANAAAHALIGLGVRPGGRVAVITRRADTLAETLLGILKAGAAYLVLDPGAPPEFLNAALAQTMPHCVVVDPKSDIDRAALPTVSGFDELTGHATARHDPGVARWADQPACIIAGADLERRPRGVEITHRGILTMTADSCWDGENHRTVLMRSPAWCEALLYELWVPLLRGGTVAVGGVGSVVESIRRWKVTAAHLTSEELATIGQEPIGSLAEVLTARGADASGGTILLRQMYGMAETTSWAVRRDGVSREALGRPMPGRRAYVLDQDRSLAPIGTAGELYIGGGLAIGYVGRPAETAECFLPDPLGPPGSRMFRTGDLARWTASGELEFLGRTKSEPMVREQLPRARRAHRSPAEEILCGLFAEVLGVDDVGVDDDFYDLGGHSLLAMRLVSRIRTTFGRELSIGNFFEMSTPSRAATALLASAGRRSRARPAVHPSTRPGAVPLSFAQRRMWFLSTIDRNTLEYNIPLALRLKGDIDTTALYSALSDVVSRHESLRTVFPDNAGEPWQVVVEPVLAHPVLPGVEIARAGLAEAMYADVCRPFDLSVDLPLRARIFMLSAEEQVLLLVFNHIAWDGLSWAPLWRDLAAAYQARREGREPDLPPLAVQYADYTLWQRQLLGSPGDPDSILARQLDHWCQALAGLPDELALPADRPRPLVSSHGAGTLRFDIDADLHRVLVALARQCRATVFMVIHASLAALLTRLGCGTDIPIGTAVAGRTDEAFDDLIGFFVNTLVLRVDTSGRPTFRELVSRVRDVDLDAYDHQDLPFDRLVEELQPTRSLSRHPLFQIMLVLGSAAPTIRIPGLEVEVLNGDDALRGEFDFSRTQHWQNSPFDLNIMLTELDDVSGISGVVDYSADLFDAATVHRLVDRFVDEMRALTTAPDDPIGPASTPSRVRPVARLEAEPAASGPRTPVEEILCDLAAQVLRVDEVRVDDSFYDLGGHSMLAIQFVSRIRTTLDADVSVADIFNAPRVRELAERLMSRGQAGGSLLPLRLADGHPPLFCVHPGSGLGWSYAELVKHLPDNVPFYVLQARGITRPEPLPTTMAEMAEDYLRQICAVQSTGPYYLLGWSFGGNVAHTMATWLQARGEQVALLAMLDSAPLGGPDAGGEPNLDPEEVDVLMRAESDAWLHFDADTRQAVTAVFRNNFQLMLTAQHDVFSGDVVYVAATESPIPGHQGSDGWRPYVNGQIHCHDIRSAHGVMLRPEPAAEIGRVLTPWLVDLDQDAE